MSIKVTSQHAWEVVSNKDQAIETAKSFEENGYGAAKFEMLDDDGAWVEVQASQAQPGESEAYTHRDVLALCDHLIHTKGEQARSMACDLRPKVEAAMLAAQPVNADTERDAERFRWHCSAKHTESDALVDITYRQINGENPTLDEWRCAYDAAIAASKEGRAMGDRELLELAAKAAGIKLGWKKSSCSDEYHPYIGLSSYTPVIWNPLVNDGDALRLAVKLFIDIDEAVYTHCERNLGDYADPYAATRRAIVRAAAAIAQQQGVNHG